MDYFRKSTARARFQRDQEIDGCGITLSLLAGRLKKSKKLPLTLAADSSKFTYHHVNSKLRTRR